VAVWEDKNIDSNLQSSSELAQVIAELEAAIQDFNKLLSCKPSVITGVLTSGAKWSLLLKVFDKGNYLSRRFGPFFLYQEENNLEISESGLESVTEMILYHLNIISNNMRRVDNNTVPVALKSNDQNNYDNNNPDDDGENDHDGTKEITQKINKMTINSTQKNQNSKSNNKENQGQSGKRNQGKKKARGLQKRNENSMLTMENMFLFNLSQIEI
jgi:hypothetical protein